MAFAYVETTFMPQLLGAVSTLLTLGIFPYALMIFAIGMIISSEVLRKNKKLL